MRPDGHLPSDEGEAAERQLDLLGRVNAKVAKEVAKSLLAIRAAKVENAASKFGCLCPVFSLAGS